jgi:ribosomal protein S27AE
MILEDKEYDCPRCGHTQKIGFMTMVEDWLPAGLPLVIATSATKSAGGQLAWGTAALVATCYKYKDGIKVKCGKCGTASRVES